MKRHLPNIFRQAEHGSTSGQHEAAKPFTKDDLSKVYFGPDAVNQASALVHKISTLHGLTIKSNLKIEHGNFAEPVPQSFGVLISPIKERSKVEGEAPRLVAVTICAVPSLDALASAGEKGMEFVQDAINAKYEQKINASVKPRSDGTIPPPDSMPKSLEDFIENRRERDTYGVYSTLAPDFVKALKKMGFDFVTPVVLRQALQSKSYASGFTVNDSVWTGILDSMIKVAGAKSLDASILVNWKNTRNESTITEQPEDLDLDKLNELLGQQAQAA